jgi:hypothetical protein
MISNTIKERKHFGLAVQKENTKDKQMSVSAGRLGGLEE